LVPSLADVTKGQDLLKVQSLVFLVHPLGSIVIADFSPGWEPVEFLLVPALNFQKVFSLSSWRQNRSDINQHCSSFVFFSHSSNLLTADDSKVLTQQTEPEQE